jgi:hypothetical protein
VGAQAYILLPLAEAREVVIDILFRCDSDTVAGGGTEPPILQCLKNLAVDCGGQTLYDNFLDYVSLFIDCDFNDHVSLKTAEFVGSDARIG